MGVPPFKETPMSQLTDRSSDATNVGHWGQNDPATRCVYNVVPPRCWVVGDLRALSHQTRASWREKWFRYGRKTQSRDPGSPNLRMVMEAKYLAFRRWLYTPCSSFDVRWARIPRDKQLVNKSLKHQTRWEKKFGKLHSRKQNDGWKMKCPFFFFCGGTCNFREAKCSHYNLCWRLEQVR